MPKFELTLTSTLPEGVKPSTEDLFRMLEVALDEAARDPSELLSRIIAAGPEPEWVIRSAAGPGMVMTEQGTWSAFTPETVPEGALHGPDAGQSLALATGQIWCRRDLILGEAVIADLHSDDRVVDLQVDIRPFLETASVGGIEELIAEDWAYAESADRAAYALEGVGDPGASRLFWYLGLNPEGTGNEQVGFGLSADGEGALRWLSENRPEVFGQLMEGDVPEGP